jgi:hypothetical protein
MMRKLALVFIVFTTISAMAGPQISIPEKHWDYGFVPQNGVLTHSYTIMNTGDDTLRISEVKPGCSCTTAPIHKQILAPGDSTTVELIFDTKVSRGRTNKNAQIISNDPVNGSERIDFSCQVYADSGYFRPVKVDPHWLVFGTNSTKFDIIVQNDTGATLELKLVEPLPQEIKLKMKDNIIKVGKRGGFSLEWKGVQPENDIEKVITFDTNSELVPRFSVPYTIKGLKGPRTPEISRHIEENQDTNQAKSTQIGKAIPSLGRPIDKPSTPDTTAPKPQPIGK